MSIESASNFQAGQVMAQVQMALARKMLDMQKTQGASAVRLIEAAGRVANKAGDSLAAAATGLGGKLDVTA